MNLYIYKIFLSKKLCLEQSTVQFDQQNRSFHVFNLTVQLVPIVLVRIVARHKISQLQHTTK